MADAGHLNRMPHTSEASVEKLRRARTPRMSRDYRAYGMAIRSDLPLPELDPVTSERIDVTIRLRPTGRSLPEPSVGTAFDFGSDTQYLAWSVVGGFLIRDAHMIDIEPAPGVDEPLLHLPLLGPVMALLLYLRGMLVLHASSVGIGDGGAIFLGDKHAGKSTAAAALVAAGHRLLADDVVAIDFRGTDGPRIAPGFPQLKLDRDAGESVIGGNAVALPEVLPGFEKRQHRLTDGFSHDPVRPTRIYILARGSAATLTLLRPQEALTSLLRFSYLTRFRSNVLSGAAAGDHMKQCAALAGSAQFYRLEVPKGLDRLNQVVQLVEANFA